MTDTQLAILVDVASNGSISTTAKKLNINRTTVVRNIKNVEDELGITLFKGRGDKTALTDNGRALFPLLVCINTSYTEMLRSIKNKTEQGASL